MMRFRGPMAETILASIDIGSHTARLLVCQKTGSSKGLRPLQRKRAYTRMAEDFSHDGSLKIQPEAVGRALVALEEFATVAEKCHVESIQAVCTGVVREADNRDDLLKQILDRTGIQARIISGDEEARLTAKGVLHALRFQGRSWMIFDLGGASTEFVYGEQGHQKVQSLALGALVLTHKYLMSDPPGEEEMGALERGVDDLLEKAFPRVGFLEEMDLLVGTGGTVTTLGAMLHQVGIEEISPKRMNGLILRKDQLEGLFDRLRTATLDERLELPGLDRGRADVIPAGCAAVLRILCFFRSRQLVVSLSDLLEGMLL
jgi:exopolyphosphatase/guanosine-5'-triphosphate,3'-diphosphate pyrophosphatase